MTDKRDHPLPEWYLRFLALKPDLITWAFKYNAFRNSLQNNPKGTVEVELGMKLPPGLAIRVLEETPTRFYLVIPAYPDAGSSFALNTPFQDLYPRDLEKKLIARIREEPALLESLKRNPHHYLEEILEVPVGEEIAKKLEFVQETPQTLYLVIPDGLDDLQTSEAMDRELSELAVSMVGSFGADTTTDQFIHTGCCLC